MAPADTQKDVRRQAVTGLLSPQQGEALIRQEWPSIAATPAASLGRILTRSIVGAPLAWLLMAPFYFLKILPFMAKRFTLTNRRVMVQRGLKPTPSGEVALADIDEVRVVKDGNSEFYRAGTLEIVSKGRVALTMNGVPEPDAFRHSILNTVKAWVPGKASGAFVPASATK